MANAVPVLDPKLTSALIGAGGASVGWLTAGMRERRRDQRRRHERSEYVQVALRAEIAHCVDILDNPEFDLNEIWKQIVSRMEADDSYVPFIPGERNDTVFQAVIGDIQILPEGTIGPVVRYYNQVFAIKAMIEDLRSDQFRQATQTQRIGMYTDYISLKLEALRLGRTACGALEDSLRRTGCRISNPGAARSDR